MWYELVLKGDSLIRWAAHLCAPLRRHGPALTGQAVPGNKVVRPHFRKRHLESCSPKPPLPFLSLSYHHVDMALALKSRDLLYHVGVEIVWGERTNLAKWGFPDPRHGRGPKYSLHAQEPTWPGGFNSLQSPSGHESSPLIFQSYYSLFNKVAPEPEIRINLLN